MSRRFDESKRQRCRAPKRKFTIREDQLLKSLVNKYGDGCWELIASKMVGRNERQCHDRWFYYLSPKINRGPWTEEEEQKLYALMEQIGPHWVQLAKRLNGRTDIQVKNHWMVLKRREEADRNYREMNKVLGNPISPVAVASQEKKEDGSKKETQQSIFPDVPFNIFLNTDMFPFDQIQ